MSKVRILITVTEVQKAVEYFKDAVEESDEIIDECSEELKAQLTEQKGHFLVALAVMKKQMPMEVLPTRIKEICRCPECRTELCKDDRFLHYCPTCGQALKLLYGATKNES